jgi:hypothetical protein
MRFTTATLLVAVVALLAGAPRAIPAPSQRLLLLCHPRLLLLGAASKQLPSQ